MFMRTGVLLRCGNYSIQKTTLQPSFQWCNHFDRTAISTHSNWVIAHLRIWFGHRLMLQQGRRNDVQFGDRALLPSIENNSHLMYNSGDLFCYYWAAHHEIIPTSSERIAAVPDSVF
jgi:hypothetical protein